MGPFTTRSFERRVAVALLLSARSPVGGQAPADSPQPPLQLQPTVTPRFPRTSTISGSRRVQVTPARRATPSSRTRRRLRRGQLRRGADRRAAGRRGGRAAEPYAQLYIGLSSCGSPTPPKLMGARRVLARKPRTPGRRRDHGKAEAAGCAALCRRRGLYDKLSAQKSLAPEDVLTHPRRPARRR